ncbi:MAG: D-alanyl-D-alanine carboxypeptidase [Caryophanon sp.]|nr:D-alanyl-D-alanine carboxypeptidase [Caryophanon sp.]
MAEDVQYSWRFKTVNKKITFMTLILIPMLLFSFMFSSTRNIAAATDLGLNVGAAILIDADTGKILYEQNAEEIVGIASVSKTITEYILLDEIAAGNMTWNDTYDMTPNTYVLSQNRMLSNVPLREDGTYEMWELYEAMAIYSANAATVAIAETIAGDEAAFLKRMNEKLDSLNIQDYKIVNATGLNNKDLNGAHPAGGATDENMMSAKSVAILAYNLLKDHPEVLETASIVEKTFREGTSDAIVMKNWNLMLPGEAYAYEGVDGLKTGTTEMAGHSFVGTAERDGKRLIAVVLNAKEKDGQLLPQTRFVPTKQLFDFGFTALQERNVLKKGETFNDATSIEVINGKQDTVNVATAEGISLVTTEDAVYDSVITLNTDHLEAPVKKGTVVGQVVLQHTDGTEYGYLDGRELTVDLVTTEDVERSGWLALFFEGVGSFYKEIWAGLQELVAKIV